MAERAKDIATTAWLRERLPNPRKVVSAALCVGAAALGTGCLDTAPDWQGPAGGLRVGVVGDSLIQFAQTGGSTASVPPHLLTDKIIAAGYQASVDAEVGANTRDLNSAASDAEKSTYNLNVTQSYWKGFPKPQVGIAVTALGTNDMHESTVPGPSNVPLDEALLNYKLHLARENAGCNVLVGVLENPPSWGLNVTAPAYNAGLKALATQTGGVYVDWTAIERGHDDAYLITGGPHMTSTGQEAYRSAIMSGIGECALKLQTSTP